MCHGYRSCGLHGVLVPDPEELKRSVWHSHTGQPAELQLQQKASQREAETTEKAKADTGQDEESVQVLVEKVLLCGLDRRLKILCYWLILVWIQLESLSVWVSLFSSLTWSSTWLWLGIKVRLARIVNVLLFLFIPRGVSVFLSMRLSTEF